MLKKRRFILIVAFIVTSVAVLLVYWSRRSLQFDSESWKSGDRAIRLRMVSNREWIHELEGKSIANVIELLGQPDRRDAKRRGQTKSILLQYDLHENPLWGGLALRCIFSDGICTNVSVHD
jgi:hypothetical protein